MTVPSCRRWFACLALTVLLAGCAAPTRVVPAAGTFELVHPEFLEQYAVTRRFRSGEPAAITVTPDGRAVLFLRSEARSNEQDLYELDLRTGAERRLLTASSLLRGAAEALTPEERARRERMRQSARGITSFDLSDDGARVLVPLSGRLYVIDRADGRVRELPDDPGAPIDPHFSPDGRRVACARDGELYVYDLDGGAGRRLTSDASDTVTNAVSEFVAQEEMGRLRGFWWSPDGRAIAYQQTDVGALETMFIADAMHPDRAPQSWRYPRPGHANAIVRLGVVGAEGGPTTWIDWDARRYPYLATVTWDEHGPLALLVQNREQTEEVLLRADPESGATTPLHVERDDAWLNLDQSVPHWLADGSFLWTTERNGAWQIEHRGRDGTL
ncbi:MAG: DPP IV N-terminal domain-containing protein, partial [Phycisphaerales bacterium]|nr:DPP IV N-terminal domain-containing protein [Phycisphaerales bacterium]